MGPHPDFAIARSAECQRRAMTTEGQFFFIIPSSFFIPSFDM